MFYTSTYQSPVGELKLITNNDSLVGLYFNGEDFSLNNNSNFALIISNEHPIILATKKWMDDYFNNLKPNINDLPLKLEGTQFQKYVWDILLLIPYGEVVTYGYIAKLIAKKLNRQKMSAQAVGGAVGKNPIAIIVPCHRVVGTNNNLTGFGGGIETKIKLLVHEKIDISKFSLPREKKK